MHFTKFPTITYWVSSKLAKRRFYNCVKSSALIFVLPIDVCIRLIKFSVSNWAIYDPVISRIYNCYRFLVDKFYSLEFTAHSYFNLHRDGKHKSVIFVPSIINVISSFRLLVFSFVSLHWRAINLIILDYVGKSNSLTLVRLISRLPNLLRCLIFI